MHVPTQAAPVRRGSARAHQITGLQQQGCNIFKCGGKVLECAAQCIPNPFSTGCVACLGSAWDSCKDCF
jgi:hypothetical protein